MEDILSADWEAVLLHTGAADQDDFGQFVELSREGERAVSAGGAVVSAGVVVASAALTAAAISSSLGPQPETARTVTALAVRSARKVI